MGTTSNEAKQRWNSSHYTQVKVSVSQELAAAFKAKCAAEGVSVASEISRFMSEKVGSKHSPKPPSDPYGTRQKRRSVLDGMLAQLGELMEAEQAYLDRIPENLRNSPQYENAELTVSILDEGINIISGAF